MDEFGFTEYFLHEVLRKRPYLRKEYCIGVVKNPLRVRARRQPLALLEPREGT
jgi:hypothetical protein